MQTIAAGTVKAVVRAVAIPPTLARRANRVLRPRDAADVYAQPAPEFARLTARGALAKVAHGYFALTPLHRLGDTTWRPDLNAVALGIAQADYGRDEVALAGISAARYHGAIPRALAVATVAAPKQRRPLTTASGRVLFTLRDTATLDVQKATTELGTGWVTTVEQTLLDLADRPDRGARGGLDAADIREAVRALAARADWELVENLAEQQHKPFALRNARTIAGKAKAGDRDGGADARS